VSPARTLGALFDGLSAEYVGCDPSTPITGLAVDSRLVAPGMAFVAIAGGSHDGHAFVADVLAAGAAAVVVQRGRIESPNGPHVWLADTAAALPELAVRVHGEPAAGLRLVGVTGTNGKTTTAHLVAAIFAAAGRKHARLGTTGNWIVDHEESATFTTPFPLELQELLVRARSLGATDVTMEVSSHALAQGRVRPLLYDAVGLTSFSQDHLDFHVDMADYLRAKCLLAAQHLRADGVAVAAVDDQPAAAAFLAAATNAGARAWRASKGADASAEIVARTVAFAATHTEAHVDTPLGPLSITTPLLGPFNLDNALVAAGLALAVGVEPHAIEAALRESRGAPGRLEPVREEGIAGPHVLVDYAHTPDAIERTIAVLRPLARARLVVVLGCGGDRDPSKRPHMGAIAARGADRFWATSDNPRTEPPDRIVDDMLAGVAPEHRDRVIREVDRAAAIACAIADADDDDIVLVAGKGHEDYQILGTTKVHFDDREHARAALRARGG
jgi:UDP-N-acetylmuramoyl-L-alanyl-D-glutamate--2,6-diaminopimelate ligase